MSMNAAVARRPRTSREPVSSPGSTNLADLLERVLDKGVVIAGEIVISLGAVELLTLKIRLLIASIDKAREIGIDWWETDPFLSSHARERELEQHATERELEEDRDQLRERLDRLERLMLAPPQEADQEHAEVGQRSNTAPASVLDQHGRVIAESKQPVEQVHEDEGPHAQKRAPQPAAQPTEQPQAREHAPQPAEQPQAPERAPQPEAAQAQQPAGAGPLVDQALQEHIAQAMRPVLGEVRERIMHALQPAEQGRPAEQRGEEHEQPQTQERASQPAAE
jgi:Gas vesicle protein